MKQINTIATILLVFGIGWAIWLLYSYHGKLKSAHSTIEAQAAQIKQYRNEKGQMISQRAAAEIQIRDLQRAQPAFEEKLKREFDIKLRNLRGYSANSFVAKGIGMADITIIPYSEENSFTVDTMSIELYLSAKKMPYGPGYYYMVDDDTVKVMLDKNRRPIFNSFQPFAIVVQDGYLDFHADVYDELNAPYEYAYSDTLEFAWHEKREKWWKAKKLYGSGKLNNKNAQIVNSESILISTRAKRFGIGPYVGYGFGGLNAGISVHWSVIKF